MNTNFEKVPSKLIELELQIKLLDYLKEEKSIDDSMYNFVVNKLINKITIEKSKVDEDYKNNITNYELVT